MTQKEGTPLKRVRSSQRRDKRFILKIAQGGWVRKSRHLVIHCGYFGEPWLGLNADLARWHQDQEIRAKEAGLAATWAAQPCMHASIARQAGGLTPTAAARRAGMASALRPSPARDTVEAPPGAWGSGARSRGASTPGASCPPAGCRPPFEDQEGGRGMLRGSLLPRLAARSCFRLLTGSFAGRIRGWLADWAGRTWRSRVWALQQLQISTMHQLSCQRGQLPSGAIPGELTHIRGLVSVQGSPAREWELTSDSKTPLGANKKRATSAIREGRGIEKYDLDLRRAVTYKAAGGRSVRAIRHTRQSHLSWGFLVLLPTMLPPRA